MAGRRLLLSGMRRCRRLLHRRWSAGVTVARVGCRIDGLAERRQHGREQWAAT